MGWEVSESSSHELGHCMAAHQAPSIVDEATKIHTRRKVPGIDRRGPPPTVVDRLQQRLSPVLRGAANSYGMRGCTQCYTWSDINVKNRNILREVRNNGNSNRAMVAI